MPYVYTVVLDRDMQISFNPSQKLLSIFSYTCNYSTCDCNTDKHVYVFQLLCPAVKIVVNFNYFPALESCLLVFRLHYDCDSRAA